VSILLQKIIKIFKQKMNNVNISIKYINYSCGVRKKEKADKGGAI
jgi:hypothetical protein